MASPTAGSSSPRADDSPEPSLPGEKVYVAVGEEVSESKATLLWALHKFHKGAGSSFVLLHVCSPSKFLAGMGARTPAAQAEHGLTAYKEMQLQRITDSLDQYLLLCAQEKINAEKLVVESDDVAQGLVDLISEYRVTALVMGAAADKLYTKKMNIPKSKKARVVQQQADPSCKIWFICKGTLIYHRILYLYFLDTRKAVPVGHDDMQEWEKNPGFTQSSTEKSEILSERWCIANTWLHKSIVKPQIERTISDPSYSSLKVEILSKARHPNVITLMGACKDAQAIVYEYMPNGSLDDRLACKDNSKPLNWQLRAHIASNICSALMFLHSNKPHNIVHSDLKGSNILLDGNNVAKLSGFGVCQMLTNEFKATTTLYRHTHPKGSFVYIDPEYLISGDLTPLSDVYSFGIILLRLLTGRSGLGLLKEVQQAVERGCLKAILDSSAGEWPPMYAEQLAQDVMREPLIAADGFTYEAEAIQEWLNSGHLGGKVLYKFADEKEKEVHRCRETEAMVQMLSQYKSLCSKRKVSAHYITHDDVVAGVVNLIKKLKIKRIVIGSSNDHVKHSTGSVGYGASPDTLASIHELCDESDDGYTTPPSDFVDDITDLEKVIEMDDSDQLVTEEETLTEGSIDDSMAYEEEISAEEADRSDEIQSFRNVTEKAEKIMAKIEKLQKKLKELQEGSHNDGERSISPRERAPSPKRKTILSQPRYPELPIPEHIAQFSMSQIGKATDNFNSRNFIGGGGYGPVYKGILGGKTVAIKLLRPHGSQGFPEYQQEVTSFVHNSLKKYIIESRSLGQLIKFLEEAYNLLDNGTSVPAYVSQEGHTQLTEKLQCRALSDSGDIHTRVTYI
ncbi:hypothetical protein PR202_gb23394 [Eleusine coracana subsp. coracana]|uniref:RING-type E3 ubiquitin transferase n=1 Tax=Eleusine coracana subsp. coracana TaxID=191504 RepID=A0AAV5FI53_ELECO|nr:hypothetical protein PR202_gb23394 [Eleusine coracana subsp. coracana]